MGFDGNHGGCCTISNRDYIIGPIPDAQETLKRVQEQFPGVEITWNDLFMTYDEGSKLFPEKIFWQDKDNYPCMRVNTQDKSFPCVFYNMHLKCCQIHNSKSIVCSTWVCDYLKSIQA